MDRLLLFSRQTKPPANLFLVFTDIKEMDHNFTIALSGYTIVEQLGETSHSSVYRALTEGQADSVILKVIGVNNPTAEQIARFKLENTLIQHLDIDGIIRPIDFIEREDLTAIVLEDFGGVTLKEILTNTLGLERILKLAIRLAEILGALHQANIIHRDIKPSNILLNPESDTLKITDFGISEIVSVSDKIAPSNMPKGTLSYLSPEQTGRMNCGVDYRTDLYSLGVTFYEMLTNAAPFQEKDPLDLIHAHIAKQPTPPCALNPQIPAPVSDIVLKLMAKSAEERYQSGFGLAADLGECLRQWQATGRIQPFALGAQDVSLRFNLPRLLVGREAELEGLHAALDRVCRGKTEIVVVSGDPGSGKSALVNEIYKPVVSRGGYFLSGKFEQFQKAVPYSAVVQSFQSLIRQLLSESDERLRIWKQQILATLGPNGRIITDVIPEMERIIGKQPPVPELGPEETQNRFNLIFKTFVRVLADRKHPLMLFLDDLQWADSASINLIQTILCDRNLHYLLFVGAYRHNDLSRSHPLARAEEAMSAAGVPIHPMRLKLLDPLDISQLLACFLKCKPSVSQPLANVIHDKTKGSPFYIHQFLKRLYDKTYLYPDPEKGGWTWELQKISSMQATDNVVAFMVDRLHDLPKETLKIVQLCAAVGDRFDLEIISTITQRPMSEILSIIDVLIQEGLMLRIENLYRFYHDRIQEAAYSLVSKAEREQLHYQIGNFELQRTDAEQSYDRIFFICDQLNQAGACITTQAEKDQLARLNLKAGIKAKESAAYAAAVSYLVSGCDLLTDATWQTDYELTFALFMEQMECQYLHRNFDEAERLFGVIIAKAATKLDKAEAYHIMIQLCTSLRTAGDAIDLGIEALKIFGLRLKIKVGRAEVLFELIKALLRLKRIGIENVVSLPSMQDEHLLAMNRLLYVIGYPAYYANKNLFVLAILKQVNSILKHGLVPQSSGAFNSFGSIVQNVWHDYELGNRIGRMALQLNDRFNTPNYKGITQHNFTLMIAHWKNHISTGLKMFREAFEYLKDTGAIIHAGFSIVAAADYRIILGHRLDDVLDELNRHQDFIKELKDPIIAAYYRQMVKYIRTLQGADSQSCALSDKDVDTWTLIEQFMREKNHFGLFIMFKFEIALNASCGNIEAAWQIAEPLMIENAKNFNGTFFEAYQCFSNLLTLTAFLSKRDPVLLRKQKKNIRSNLRRLRKWARMCPENFQHMHDLVAAEVAGLEGRFQAAMKLYNDAISAAQANKFLPDEAYAYQRLGDFYLAWNYKREAGLAFQLAHRKYSSWGANAKADALRKRYPDFFDFRSSSARIDSQSGTTSSEYACRNLDLSTVMEASHIISSEIMLDRLLSMTMQTAITSAGAQRGYLMLLSDKQLIVQAREDISTGEKQVLQALSIDACQGLSHGIVNYVHHSGEPLILHNAVQSGDFTNDPHVIAHQCKSILCLPILNKGMFTGILYMENNLTTEAFTAERIEILRVIAAQAAISIQNAQLYEDISTEISVRKNTEAALRVSEQKYRTILEEMPDIYCETDLDGRITFANPAASRIMGYQSSEVIGTKIQQYLTATYQQGIERYYHEIHVTGRPGKPFSDTLVTKTGKLISMEILASPMRDDDGRIIGFRNVIRDDSERKRLEKDLLESYDSVKNARAATILGLAKLAEYRDEDTGTHLERIREYARLIALQLSKNPKYKGYITEEYIEDIYNSSILHDIGKVGVPDAILLKPDKLTREEFEIIKTHAVLGGDALRELEAKIQGQTFLTLGKEIAYYHHEKWDGSGYPKGLKGEQIPLSARIVALADVYDALTSRRCYKEAFSHQKTVEIIVKDRGTHFAPDVVDAFLIHADAFQRIRHLAHEQNDQESAA